MHESARPRVAKILSMDAGGTLTDTFVVDERGEFVVGKALTTPADESVGFLASASDALGYWGMGVEQAFPTIASSVYSGTAMINRLLERKGQRLGVIVTAGFEDYLRLERGLQTYLGYSYSDRLHVVTHVHNSPLVPRSRIFGVRGRIDLFGVEQIPLYENDIAEAIRHLAALDVDAICVSLLFSYANSAHELRVRECAAEVLRDLKTSIPLFLSSELYPVEQDFARLNTLLIEAYAAEPSRSQLQRVQRRAHESGSTTELRVMASHGGTISIEAKELARTLVSGPIGGVVGARYLARELGFDNVACSDIGGTSFDLALVTGGQLTIRTQPTIARFVLKLPLVEIDSVGAGTGSFVRLTPRSKRIEIGPDSAGYRIGVCFPDGGVSTPTITDCDLVLGYLNPDNFLGGDIKLDPERAYRAISEQLADPLGLDPYDAAEGVVSLFQDHLRNELQSRILGKGYSAESYRLLSYGGGGPVHVAGYSEGMAFSDILVPSWAAGFSAFGCACADYEYRSEKTVRATLQAGLVDEAADAVNAAWDQLEGRVLAEFAKSHVPREVVELRSSLRVQYVGQLNDVEIALPFGRIATEADIGTILEQFEEAYTVLYARAAKSPELGYVATTAIVSGVAPAEKPRLPDEALGKASPPPEAGRGNRSIYHRGGWVEADVYDMASLQPGNELRGFSVLESPSTTFVIPSGRDARLDAHRIFHLSLAPSRM